MLVFVIFCITLFFLLCLARIRLDNNNFRFIPKNAEARLSMNEVCKLFGDEVPILIGLEREYSGVLDAKFLTAVQELQEKIERMPLVKNTVSLLNTTHIEAKDGAFSSSPLIPKDFAGTKEEILEIKKKIRDWSVYERTIVSADLKAMQLFVFLNVSDEESGSPIAMDACRQMMKMVDGWNFRDSVAYITGLPVFNEVVNEATSHDLSLLIPLVILVVVLVLLVSFRRFSGVLLPLLTVSTSTIWAIGAMGLFAVPLSILSTVLPVILIAVGSAYSIHVVNAYYDDARGSVSSSKAEHKELVIKALDGVIRPISLAALTTFAGFFSFCFTSVPPIFEFGLFSSLGILFAYLISITLIPAVLILRGPKQLEDKMKLQFKGVSFRQLDIFLAKTLLVISEHMRSVILFAFVAVAISIFGIKRVSIDNVLMEYFEDDVAVIKSDSFAREKFAGSKLLNIVVSSDVEGKVVSSSVLKACDDLSLYLSKEVPNVGKVTSAVDLIKRLNQVFNASESPQGIAKDKQEMEERDFGDFGDLDDAPEDDAEVAQLVKDGLKTTYTQHELMTMLHDAVSEREGEHIAADEVFAQLARKMNYKGSAYYEIPTSISKYAKKSEEELDAIIRDYLVVLKGNLSGMIDNVDAPHALKINVQLRTTGQKDTDKVLAIIQEFIDTNFPKQDLTVKLAGSVLVEKALNNLVVHSQLISLSISLFIVFLILSIYYKSVLAGVLGAVPLVISILMNFAFMGFLNIKLNIGTAMVASFAIGIGIDYTIHYLAAFQKEILASQDVSNVLYKSFLGSGKAILFNATSVGAGFAVLMFSSFNMLSDLGFLIALIMASSSLGSLTVLPTLLSIAKPNFFHKHSKKQIE